jgi:hypothetical protein
MGASHCCTYIFLAQYYPPCPPCLFSKESGQRKGCTPFNCFEAVSVLKTAGGEKFSYIRCEQSSWEPNLLLNSANFSVLNQMNVEE